MKGMADINAGICGFTTSAIATSEDQQFVTFEVLTKCDKISRLATKLGLHGPLDAYQEISPASDGVFMEIVQSTLTGCCSGCIVPSGLFKTMQVAAGLALPKDMSISIKKAT